MKVGIGVSDSMRTALIGANKPLPQLQMVNALVDTGASGSVIDPALVVPLGIQPVSSQLVHTPSTGGVPVSQPVYDVSIWLYHAKSQHVWERSFPVMCAGLRGQGIDMLLGRDVLSECLMVFDGPHNKFTIAF